MKSPPVKHFMNMVSSIKLEEGKLNYGYCFSLHYNYCEDHRGDPHEE